MKRAPCVGRQNRPLAPLTASSLIGRKPCSFPPDNTERFALRCQELEEGWQGKLVAPYFHS